MENDFNTKRILSEKEIIKQLQEKIEELNKIIKQLQEEIDLFNLRLSKLETEFKKDSNTPIRYYHLYHSSPLWDSSPPGYLRSRYCPKI